MTTKEVRAALISMPYGTKFSHPYFTDDEYVYTDEKGNIKTEDGYYVINEFWDIRKDWTGWYIK